LADFSDLKKTLFLGQMYPKLCRSYKFFWEDKIAMAKLKIASFSKLSWAPFFDTFI